jgi:serine protease Do
LLLCAALGFLPAFSPGQEPGVPRNPSDGAATLVRVTIFTESLGGPESFVLGGRSLSDYRPKIYRFFPGTGIVFDQKGHVISYLGYRWLDLQDKAARVEIVTLDGERHPGKLVGIDQSLGVAVVQAEGVRLLKTPVCIRCEIRPDDVVVFPVFPSIGPATFENARILTVGTGSAPGGGAWQINLNRPLQGFGEPVLNRNHRVLGFVAENELFYPISQLMTSAEKILQAGGDIRTGWLGVFVDVEDAQGSSGGGVAVRVSKVEEESPASKAGLQAGDILKKWNGKELGDAWAFIRSVQETAVGSRATVEIVRQGRSIVLPVTIEARKAQASHERFVFSFPGRARPGPEAGADGGAKRPASLGIETVALTPRLAYRLSLPVGKGLLVSRIDLWPDDETAPVRVGDIILEVDGQPTVDPDGFSSFVQSRRPGARISLRILRDGEERVTSLQLPERRSNP